MRIIFGRAKHRASLARLDKLKLKEVLAESRKPLARARASLNQQLLLSRDREGAVLLADSAEFCKSL
jgi:hypothetical protein